MSQNNFELKEQRHHTRTALDLPAELRLDAITYAVWIQDISLKGVLITDPSPTFELIKPQSTGHLALFSDPERMTLLELDIKIVRIKPRQIGATWHTIDLDNLTQLRALLNVHFADPDLLTRDLGELVH
ncbi:MAG: PilZ domain-containing protein [Halothiobacillus sp.]